MYHKATLGANNFLTRTTHWDTKSQLELKHYRPQQALYNISHSNDTHEFNFTYFALHFLYALWTFVKLVGAIIHFFTDWVKGLNTFNCIYKPYTADIYYTKVQSITSVSKAIITGMSRGPNNEV